MSELEQLRAKNECVLHSVEEAGFAAYGEVLQGNYGALQGLLAATPMPSEKNIYVASDSAMEALGECEALTWQIYGGLPMQMGYCNGHNTALGAEEWHDCSEVDIAGTSLVLLLAAQSDLENGVLTSARVKAFYLPAGTAVRLWPGTLHFSPCAVSRDGFRCLIGLSKGTNAPLTPQQAAGRAPLRAFNKWLIAHPARKDLIASGAREGITGENITIHF